MGLASPGGTASFALLPVFPANARASDGAPINLISVKVFATPDDVEVASITVAVDPDEDQWELTIDFPLSTDAATLYYLELALINETEGVQTVEWSARTTPVAVTPGVSREVRQAEVVRGPVDNLAVTALLLTGPETVPEGESFVVTADVAVSDPAAEVAVFWTSLDPEVATVAADGTGLALQAGTARVQAAAGTVEAVHTFTVLGVPSAVVVTPESALLTALGEEVELQADVVDGQGSPLPDAEVTWSIADETVLEESAPGVFRAIGAGETTVTATAGEVTSEAVVITVEQVLSTIEVTPEGPVTLASIGATQSLSAVAQDSGGAAISGVTFTWVSDDTDVATVAADGTVTAVANGTANITASAAANGSASRTASASDVMSNTVVVTVAQTVSSIEVTPAGPVTLTSIGATHSLGAVAKDAGGATVSGVTFTWTSHASGAATVASNGTVTAVANGTANITASASGVTSNPVAVTVAQAVASIEVTPTGPVTLTSIGATHSFSAVAKDAGGASIGGVTFTWTSDATGVATVASDGTVTAVADGTTEIAASASGVTSNKVAVTVTGEVASIEVTLTADPEVRVDILDHIPVPSLGIVVALTATAKDAGGATISGVTFTWASDNTSVATVSSDGVVTIVGNGTANISVSAGAVTVSATLLVAQVLDSIEVTPTGPVLLTSVGATQSFSAVAKDEGGTAISSVTSFTWVSDNTGAATVASNGTVIAVANGGANITASAGAVTSNAVAVTVAQAVSSIEVTPTGPFTLTSIGATLSFSAVAKDAGGASIGGVTFTWASDATGVATVASNGTVTAVANGTANITASASAVTSNAVSVTVAVLVQWAMVAPGKFDTCATTSGGAAHCWGRNNRGQVGDSTTIQRTTPTPVSGGLTFASITAGDGHACGITSAGAAYCWGYNVRGQLGDGTTTDRTTPTAVSGGLMFSSIAAADFHTCAITSASAAYCWGSNQGGRLGDGTSTNRTTPTAVSGELTFSSIAGGGFHTCGLLSAGTAYCWGQNGNNQLGDGSMTNQTTPSAVSGGLTFSSIAVGWAHTCGIASSGSAYCWGYNPFGQLGDGTTTEPLSPR